MQQVNVLGLRGLAGNFYSTGIDVFALKAGKIPGVDYTPVAGYESWKVWRTAISSFKDRTVLVPHSFGVLAAIRIAEELPHIDFPLMIAFDASPYCSWRIGKCGPGPVPNNIKRVVNFYQRNSFLIKGQPLYRADGTALGIINFRVNDSDHGGIEDRADLHNEGLEEIKRVINA